MQYEIQEQSRLSEVIPREYKDSKEDWTASKQNSGLIPTVRRWPHVHTYWDGLDSEKRHLASSSFKWNPAMGAQESPAQRLIGAHDSAPSLQDLPCIITGDRKSILKSRLHCDPDEVPDRSALQKYQPL